MRGGVRLPAMAVTIGLLAGCSDPAGAVRRQRAAAARKASPSASPSATAKPHAAAWFQAPGRIHTANGLRVHTGALRAGRMKVAISDVRTRAARTLVATVHPHGAVIGGFTLTSIKIAKNPETGAYGVTFHYRHR
jgi:hypothetical protein